MEFYNVTALHGKRTWHRRLPFAKLLLKYQAITLHSTIHHAAFALFFFSSPAHCSFKCHNGPATSSGTNRLTKHCIMFYSIIYMKWALCICTLNVCENVTRSHRCLHTYCCFGRYCCCCCLAAIRSMRDSHPIFIAIILGSHHNNRRTIQKRKNKKTKRHQPPSYYCYVSRSVLTLYSQYNHNSTLYFFFLVCCRWARDRR